MQIKFIKLNQENKAFTLLETLIALAVVSIGIMGAFTLSLANLKTANDNYHRILAVNLAREGIELVRNIRDSNWLKIDNNLDCDSGTAGLQPCTWDQGLDYGTSTIDYNYAADSGLEEVVVSMEACFNSGNCRLKENSFLYSHNGAANYSNVGRLIILKAICFDTDQSESSDYTNGATEVSDSLVCDSGGFEEKVGLQVTSQVYWLSSGKSYTLNVIENLYNWREYAN